MKTFTVKGLSVQFDVYNDQVVGSEKQTAMEILDLVNTALQRALYDHGVQLLGVFDLDNGQIEVESKECEYCGMEDCELDCDESQAGGFD
jgi:hypothetical protein